MGKVGSSITGWHGVKGRTRLGQGRCLKIQHTVGIRQFLNRALMPGLVQQGGRQVFGGTETLVEQGRCRDLFQ